MSKNADKCPSGAQSDVIKVPLLTQTYKYPIYNVLNRKISHFHIEGAKTRESLALILDNLL